MRKIYQMFLALAVIMLGATNVLAGERISLQEVPFCTWDSWGADAKSTGTAECLWVIGEGNTNVYGDTSVKNYADLTSYSKLIVVVSDGTPRFLFNRDVDEGQWNADESQSHLIEYPKDGWSSKYFSQDEETKTYTIDVNQIVKDKGYCHLHAIKGANWQNVVIVSMEVEKADKAKQIGWTNLINNSDMEGDDVSSFFTKVAQGAPEPSVITDGVGVGGTRGIKVEATAKKAEAWDNQFWFRFNEILPAEAKYRLSFDYRADTDATVSTQAHAEPSDYIHYEMLGNLSFTSSWQNFTAEGTVTSQQAGPNSGGGLFTSIAFNLNELADANNYYFDNIVFEVYKAGITAEYYMDVIQMDFGFDTNIAELVKASGMPRLLFPKDMVKVTVDGQEAEIISVEGFADGRFYIFMQDGIEGGKVHVKLTNPKDAAYHLIYTNGPGGDVTNFDDDAEENEEVALVDDAYAYIFVAPTVIAADPEDGSFNLPNSISEFKLTLDKEADCSKIVAKLNKTNLTVSPSEGFASEITLKRSGDDLPTGEYTISVSKIFCAEPITEDDFTEYTYKISVGKIEADPDDKEETAYEDNFADSENPGAGWIVNNGDDAGTMQPANSGAGCRLMHGQSGFAADILYLGQRGTPGGGVALYGTEDGYKLTLKAKNYHLTLGSAQWDGDGAPRTLKVQVLPEAAVNAADGTVIDESQILVEEMKAIEPIFKSSKDATLFDLIIPVKEAGNYVIRLVPGNSAGNPAGYSDANAIGNIKVQYLPNTAGGESLRLIAAALEAAKTTLAENDDERHHGVAFETLDAAVKKYEAEYPSYTAPSKYKAAADALNEANTTMKNHANLINTYDPLPAQAQDIVDNNADSKFNQAELYVQLKEVAAKYVEKKTVKQADPETGEEYEVVVAEAKPLVDDTELQTAIDELQDIVNAAQRMFTEGESKTSSDVGIKVLVDRIRQGAEGLMQLGVAESDPLIVRANNAVSDDDALAEELKNRLKLEFYNKMKNGENLFPVTVDESTLEETTPTYNFTVFVKNPNTYAWKESAGVTEENCPGWTMVEGNAGLTNMWNGSYPGDIDGLPKDLCITQYHQTNRIEQTITDLPAGIYTVMIDAAEWSDEFTPGENDDEETIATKEANHEMNRVYVKTSDTPAYEEGAEEVFKADARIDHHGQYVGRYENYLTDIEVTDGVLTLGVKWNNLAQFMFDRVQILLAAPAAGFDYAKAYEDVMTDIDQPAAKTAKVIGIQIFDLNGQMIPTAKKGVNIVKKYMSDGTIVTEKVMVK